ncbi:hypothetical protein Pmar_PMAR024383 [Perkinsus marinus ATCC 50983]|uniref:Uncharacterized protein n=1 Tax=Perkinsus marinus (strain ATCC 50983 / TXsc) TaxID=423536 RepID=C5KLY1_PERM5|nr:hypothetical protein Pmar_PMAR024383 [Perkinsus marinus ATCC 50983]EER14496.1 hypothetical protein Pmar_PMAR024383 [Perkinsus marinus ATCC 50983]|eukprot:XP_002782701.1 hypothetical protein Pmar_PMAR024383 [Perkinsus marinus ATCC 50983]
MSEQEIDTTGEHTRVTDGDMEIESQQARNGQVQEEEAARVAAENTTRMEVQIAELQNEVLKMRNAGSTEMGRALAITKAMVPYDPKKQTFEEWRSKFEGRAKLLRLPYQELLEFMGLCLSDKPWEVYNRRLNNDPKEPPERIYFGIIEELTKQYSETPKHAFSSLCKLRYKRDVYRHSTEIHRLTKLAFPKLNPEARDQIGIQVFWKSLPQSKIVEGYYNTFNKLPKQTLSEAVTLVGDSLDSVEETSDSGEEEKVVAVAHWSQKGKGALGLRIGTVKDEKEKGKEVKEKEVKEKESDMKEKMRMKDHPNE